MFPEPTMIATCTRCTALPASPPAAGTLCIAPPLAGALLFIGDGHARQGHAEVVGTGLETSMDVEFTVDLVKKKTIGWPRLENETHVMVLGSERPLLQALQHATTELQRWLVADYGLSERAAATLMGQALEYDIANVVERSDSTSRASGPMSPRTMASRRAS